MTGIHDEQNPVIQNGGDALVADFVMAVSHTTADGEYSDDANFMIGETAKIEIETSSMSNMINWYPSACVAFEPNDPFNNFQVNILTLPNTFINSNLVIFIRHKYNKRTISHRQWWLLEQLGSFKSRHVDGHDTSQLWYRFLREY